MQIAARVTAVADNGRHQVSAINRDRREGDLGREDEASLECEEEISVTVMQ